MVVIVRKIPGYFREIVWLVKYYEPFGQIFALLKIRFLTAPAGPIVDGLCLKVLSEQKVSKATGATCRHPNQYPKNSKKKADL